MIFWCENQKMGVNVAFSAVNYSSPFCGLVKCHLQGIRFDTENYFAKL